MKITWDNVGDIAIGVFGAGVLLLVLNAFFGSWLQQQGAKIMKR